MSKEKHILIRKIITNGLNMDLPVRAWEETFGHAVEAHKPFGKEKIPSREGSK